MATDIESTTKVKFFFRELGLNEYQSSALAHLYLIGECKAPKLGKIAGIPKARIYETMDDLVRMGFARKKTGRPILFIPVEPKKAMENFVLWKKEKLTSEIINVEHLSKKSYYILHSLYEKSKKVKKPGELLEVIPVGQISEIETKNLYSSAKKEIDILTKAFEYFPRIKDILIKAKKSGVDIKILFLSKKYLSNSSQKTQNEMKNELKNLDIKFKETKHKLPLRGTIIDPDIDSYQSGKAIILVENVSIPNILKEAAITNNPSFVAGLKQYFDFLWKEI